jgi:hypothetical protein
MNEEMSPEPQELRYNAPTESTENLITGGLAGLAAALVGAGTWAAVTYYTNYQIGFMAIGVGYLVGIAMRKFGHGQSAGFGVLAAALAVIGCVVGNLLSACAFAVDGLRTEGVEVTMMELVTSLTPSSALEILKEGFSPIDALFYLLAVSAAYRSSTAADQ